MVFDTQVRWRMVLWLLLAFAVPFAISMLVTPWVEAFNLVLDNTYPGVATADKARLTRGIIWFTSFLCAIASQGVCLLYKAGPDAGIARMGPEELRSLAVRYNAIADKKDRVNKNVSATERIRNGKPGTPS